MDQLIVVLSVQYFAVDLIMRRFVLHFALCILPPLLFLSRWFYYSTATTVAAGGRALGRDDLVMQGIVICQMYKTYLCMSGQIKV